MHGISRMMVQNTRCDARKCLLGVHTMADNILGFKFPQNRQKWPSISMFKRQRTQDEWRHRRLTSLACSRSQRPSGVYYL